MVVGINRDSADITSLCAGRCGTMRMRDLIRGHLHHAYAFIPSFSLLHPFTGLDNPRLPSMSSNFSNHGGERRRCLKRHCDRIRPSILIYSDGSATKIEATPSLSFHEGKKLGQRGVKTIKIIIDRFEQMDF